MPAVKVNRKAVGRIESGHPWIFASDIVDAAEAQPGDAVRVVDPRGKNLGTAHYSSTSQITLRLLSNHAEPVDRAFLEARVRAAHRHRQNVVRDSDAYRLIHAEGDLLPGLIVDQYNDCLAVQFLDQGMDRLKPLILDILSDLLQPRAIVVRNDAASRAKEGLPSTSEVARGELPARVSVHMNGLELQGDLLHGQKTGIYLDQRENYRAVAEYARGRALDCFTATGGFALHLAGKCESVEAVDSSAPTLESARANAAANGITNVNWLQADVLDYLPSLVAARRHFQVIVVDPPAFTKARGAVEGASRGYKEVNLRALRLLHKGGMLVTCSCSFHMSEAHLLEIVAAAALDSGKRLRVLERRTQSKDHPILLTVPETHYLKCLLFEVL